MQYKLRNGMLDITLFSSLNLSKSCVVCTFEFLISPSRRHSTYRSTTSGYSHGWLADRTPTAGVPGRRFIKDLVGTRWCHSTSLSRLKNAWLLSSALGSLSLMVQATSIATIWTPSSWRHLHQFLSTSSMNSLMNSMRSRF